MSNVRAEVTESQPDNQDERDPHVSRGVDAFVERTDYPLIVVTTASPHGELSGCLAGFITQCSIEPPRFLVCISKTNHTFDVVTRSEVLALHLLGQAFRHDGV
jgi:flavin reductase (DIM6/NTAB) family NADH-FMN oxidoreductase RutF